VLALAAWLPACLAAWHLFILGNSLLRDETISQERKQWQRQPPSSLGNVTVNHGSSTSLYCAIMPGLRKWRERFAQLQRYSALVLVVNSYFQKQLPLQQFVSLLSLDDRSSEADRD
jgi:hypothetical protein